MSTRARISSALFFFSIWKVSVWYLFCFGPQCFSHCVLHIVVPHSFVWKWKLCLVDIEFICPLNFGYRNKIFIANTSFTAELVFLQIYISVNHTILSDPRWEITNNACKSLSLSVYCRWGNNHSCSQEKAIVSQSSKSSLSELTSIDGFAFNVCWKRAL